MNQDSGAFPAAMLDAWEQLLAAFRSMVDGTPPGLRTIKPSAQDWSLQEIIGHLIDSATNNLQRFMRLQGEAELVFPGYEAETWVMRGHYQSGDWDVLVGLWWHLNQQVLHVISRLPEGCLHHVWLKGSERLELALIVPDYFSHLELHREHFAHRSGEVAVIAASGPRLPRP